MYYTVFIKAITNTILGFYTLFYFSVFTIRYLRFSEN